MKKLVLVLSLVLSIISFTQTRDEFNLILLPQGYGLKLLNSFGNSSIINDVSNIGFMNPASISQFNNYTFGISYQVNSNINEAYPFDIGTSRVYNFYPQSFGAVAKWEGFTFGLGFGQRYNGTKDFDPIPVTTVQQPDGTGEFIDIIEEKSIHSYSLSASYSFKEFLETDFDIDCGVKYSLNRLHQYVKLWDTEVNSTGYYSSYGVGITTALNLDKGRKLTVGIIFESENKFRAKAEYKNPPVVYDIDPTDTTHNYLVIQAIPELLYNTPSELTLDLAVDATEELYFLTSFKSVFWKTDKNNLKNQTEYTFTTAYRINESVLASLGFYSTDYIYEDDILNVNGKYSAIFLTCGLKINFNRFNIALAVADSHLFSGDYTKQTIGKLSFGINL